jgi:arylsulfatase
MTDHPPNILLLFPDQWRWDWLGCVTSPYGKVPVHTPHIDALAARGTLYTQCRTNSPLCAPARACLATGTRYDRCGVPNNGHDLDTARPNVFQLLRADGYRVAVTGKPDLRKHGKWKGLDGWTQHLGRLGFSEAIHHAGKHDAVNTGAVQPQDAYMAHLHRAGLAATHVADYQRRGALRRQQHIIDANPTPLPREHYTDDFCGRAAESFLDRWGVGEPWLLWVNFPGPHEPFDPPVALLRHYDGVTFPDPVNPGDDQETEQDHQAIRRSYAAMCEGIDEWVGRLIAAVDRRGERDRTIVVFCSDHGEMLGDHSLWYKQYPHEGSVHVPLIVAGPGVPAGEVRDDLVELIDLSASCLTWAGLDTPDDWDARPLSIAGGEPRRVQVSGLGDWRMICDGRYKLVARGGKPAELYDLSDDPTERHNIMSSHAALADELMLRLSHELGGAAAK